MVQTDSSYVFSQVREKAHSLGFLEVGYATASPLHKDMEMFVKAMDCGYFAELNYLKRNLEKRENIEMLVDGAKSVLVFLAPYGKNIVSEENEYINIVTDNALKRYKVAQYALGSDYHTVIRSKLNMVLELMQELDPNIKGRVFTDTAPVLERSWAVQAGLGFIGKNNFFISRRHGIRNFIGIIASNFELSGYNDEAKGKTIEKRYCGSCTRCIDACPTGALCAPYTLDARKCISYLTIENKEASFEQNSKEADGRKGWVFGCDACMNACIWNSRNKPGWPEFEQVAEPLPHTHLKRR